ncbi:hypothetical protein VTN77DRAFT_7531 [Rasamsonia byssochlamydoides]|uniref:uncharacterized protein n=1 Tax=Rasamsonia byssochlamydoides TaxID=89139 RepID=UPI003742EEAD
MCTVQKAAFKATYPAVPAVRNQIITGPPSLREAKLDTIAALAISSCQPAAGDTACITMFEALIASDAALAALERRTSQFTVEEALSVDCKAVLGGKRNVDLWAAPKTVHSGAATTLSAYT